MLFITAIAIIGVSWNSYNELTSNSLEKIDYPTISLETGNDLSQIFEELHIDNSGFALFRQDNGWIDRSTHFEFQLTNEEMLILDDLLQNLNYSKSNKPKPKELIHTDASNFYITIIGSTETNEEKWERRWTSNYIPPEDINKLYLHLESIIDKIFLDKSIKRYPSE